jgi:tetratricopeptide (TPR) repeat protein
MNMFDSCKIRQLDIFLAIIFCGMQARADWCVLITNPATARALGGTQQCGYPDEPSARAAVAGVSPSFYRIYENVSPQEIDRRRRQSEAEALAKQGSDAWDKGNWDDAINFYQQAADKYPEDDSYLENVAKARNNKSNDQAKALAKQGSDAWDNKNWDDAIKFYQQAADTDMDPHNKAVYLDNVAKARNNKHIDEANALNKAGNDAMEKKDWNAAVDFFQKAMKEDPKWAGYPENLGLALEHMGPENYAKAQEYFELASKLGLPDKEYQQHLSALDDNRLVATFNIIKSPTPIIIDLRNVNLTIVDGPLVKVDDSLTVRGVRDFFGFRQFVPASYIKPANDSSFDSAFEKSVNDGLQKFEKFFVHSSRGQSTDPEIPANLLQNNPQMNDLKQERDDLDTDNSRLQKEIAEFQKVETKTPEILGQIAIDRQEQILNQMKKNRVNEGILSAIAGE